MRQEFVTFVTLEEASEHSPGVYAMRPACQVLWPVTVQIGQGVAKSLVIQAYSE